MSYIDSEKIEKMYKESIDEVNGEGYSELLKKSDSIQYQVGLREFEDNINFNLEQQKELDRIENPWQVITFVQQGNEEAIKKEYLIIYYSIKKGETITEDSIAESLLVFEDYEEAKIAFKEISKILKKINKKIVEGASKYEKKEISMKNIDYTMQVSPKTEVSYQIEKTHLKLEEVFNNFPDILEIKNNKGNKNGYKC